MFQIIGLAVLLLFSLYLDLYFIHLNELTRGVGYSRQHLSKLLAEAILANEYPLLGT